MFLQTDMLSLLPEQDRQDLFSRAQHQTFRRHEILFHAGSPPRFVYFLTSGRVKIYHPSPGGKEVILWFCFPGEMFGFAEAAYGSGRAVNAQACEPTEVLCLSQAELELFLRAHPSTAVLIMQTLASRLRSLGDTVVNMVNDDAQTRITKLILRLASLYGIHLEQEIHLDIHFTHQEIADMTGTTRQTVTSVISQLQRQGLMTLENRRIHIGYRSLLDSISRPH